jgi:protein SCO1
MIITRIAIAALLVTTCLPSQAQRFWTRDGSLPADTVLKEVRIDQKINEQVPLDLKFHNEQGKEVRLQDYFGKRPVVLTLVYYGCPMLCTQVLTGLTRSMRGLGLDIGKDFDILTVSFDPGEKFDLAAEKKENYLKEINKPGAANGWNFLVGAEPEIKKLTDSVGFRYVYDEKIQQYAHAAAIMVLTPQGKVSRYLFGIDFPPRDLRLALVEASSGKVGSISDQILLLCYHYDPATGRYGATILTVLRISSILTMIILVGFMVVSARRRARMTQPEPGGSP